MGSIFFILFFATSLLLYFGSLVWIYRDAQLRGKPAFLVAFLAAVMAWPVSLLVWIALRPPIPPWDGRGGRRSFNLQDFRR
jgi:hypothetical protein